MTRGGALAAFAIGALVVFGINFSTIKISPVVWQDEVEIVEYGRTSLPGSDLGWGINWQLPEGKPLLPLYYVGPLYQEFWLRWLGGPVGPRIGALVGGILAAFSMCGWLLARGISPALGLMTAFLFLVDPMISQSFRGARVDALAMGFFFLACWIIRADSLERGNWHVRLADAAAGACLGLGGMVWASVAVVAPMVVFELASRGGEREDSRIAGLRRALPSFLYICLFATLTVLAALALFPGGPMSGVQGFSRLFSRTQVVAGSPGARDFLLGARSILASFAYDPLMPIVGVAFIAANRRYGLLLALLAAVTMVLLTHSYIHRVIYLVPYLLLAIALGVTSITNGQSRRLRLIAWSIPTVLILWSSAVSLGARTVIANRERGARNPDLILRAARSVIGSGPVRVYVEPYEFYYAGRQLGWRMYRSVFSGSLSSRAGWTSLARTLDCLILSKSVTSPALSADLRDLGFEEAPLEIVDASDPTRCLGSETGKGYCQHYVAFRMPPAKRSAPSPGSVP